MTDEEFSGMDMEDFSEEDDLQEASMISLKRQLIASEEVRYFLYVFYFCDAFCEVICIK